MYLLCVPACLRACVVYQDGLSSHSLSLAVCVSLSLSLTFSLSLSLSFSIYQRITRRYTYYTHVRARLHIFTQFSFVDTIITNTNGRDGALNCFVSRLTISPVNKISVHMIIVETGIFQH